jgi:hypothetical protein
MNSQITKKFSQGNLVLKLIVPFITLYFMYTAYDYLKGLDNCNCIQSLHDNIQNIKNIELCLIFIQTIGIVINYSIYFFHYQIDWVRHIPFIIPFLSLYILLILLIMICFIYNVYQFGGRLPKNCKCADQWQNDILYVQGGLYFISSSIITLSLLYSISILWSIRK